MVVRHEGSHHFDSLSASQIEGGIGDIHPIFGRTLYVDGVNGSDNNSGLAPGQAVKTLEQALATSIAGDVIVVAPATYTLATANLPFTPKANQTWRAAVLSPVPNVVLTDDAGGSDTDLVDIEVANVTFVGFRFLAAHADVARLVKVADTVSVLGATFLNCWFDALTFATVNGISAVDGTFTTTGLKVLGSRFVGCDVGIDVGVLGIPKSVIRGNTFELNNVSGADVGIALADTGAGATGYGFVIEENDFIGPTDFGADAVGISIAGTENLTGIGIIRNNFFAYCNLAAITADKLDRSLVNNYVGDTGTGGTLVDSGTP